MKIKMKIKMKMIPMKIIKNQRQQLRNRIHKYNPSKIAFRITNLLFFEYIINLYKRVKKNQKNAVIYQKPL